DRRKIDGDDVDRAVKRKAETETEQARSAETRPPQKRKVDERLPAQELDQQKQRQEYAGGDPEIENHRAAEPVVTLTFLEHDLERAEADRHAQNAQPVSVPELAELHRL